jgi:hypothetical protein
VKPLKKKDLKMKKISSILIAVICFTSCKNEPKITYKYQQKEDLFYCDAIDMDLIKEAVYAFEDYIENHYSMEPPNSVDKGYYFYWEISKSDRIPAVELINPHILEIRDELKKIENLWIINNDEAKLNMNHPIAKCIGDYMEDQQLKKIYDVLVESNTFKNLVFLAPLKRDPIKFRKDRALVTYLALNTFYARILTLDFSNLEELMKINRERFIEEQKRLREENKENIQLIKLDSIRNQ